MRYRPLLFFYYISSTKMNLMEIDHSKESTLELLGAAGFFCAAGGIIQAFMMIRFSRLLWVALGVYALVFISYLLLYKMKPLSTLALIVSGSLLFLLQVVFLLQGGILWLSVVLSLFTLVTVVLIYIQELYLYMRAVAQDSCTSIV